LQIGHDTLLYFCLQRFFYNPIPVLSIQGWEREREREREGARERERDLNNKPGFPFRKGTLLSSSWKSASNPAKVSSDLLCFWLPLLLLLLLLLYLAIIMQMQLIHQVFFLCGWSVFVGFGYYYYYPRVKKSSYIYIYEEFSTFGNISGGTPKANLDFTQKFPAPPHRPQRPHKVV
jgi:hypothetical protein